MRKAGGERLLLVRLDALFVFKEKSKQEPGGGAELIDSFWVGPRAAKSQSLYR